MHKILSKDIQAMTGVCSICGPIRLKSKSTRKPGVRRYLCSKSQGRWRSKSSGAYRYTSRLKREYNLSDKDHKAMFDAQHGLCAICTKSLKLVVDHNHTTRLIRGLLCSQCNRCIGLLKDDILVLRNMIKYLENPPAIQALGGDKFTPR